MQKTKGALRPGQLLAGSAAERAARRYAAKLRRGAVSRRSDGSIAAQTRNYRAWAEHAALRTLQLRQVLGELNVPPVLSVAYSGFTMCVDKQVRNYDHAALENLVHHAIERWTCHGCDPEVLKAICEQVFGL